MMLSDLLQDINGQMPMAKFTGSAIARNGCLGSVKNVEKWLLIFGVSATQQLQIALGVLVVV